MARSLVIVESPAKAGTLGKFLGKDFTVTASYGHVRDLTARGSPSTVRRTTNPSTGWCPEKRRRSRSSTRLVKKADARVPRRRPRPRGRGDLLAPARAAQEGGAERHLPPRRVQRDHEDRRPARDREARQDLEGPRRRPAGAPHHRPPGRLRGLRAALEQGLAGPERRSRPDGGAADHRRARDRARGVRRDPVLLGAADAREGGRGVPGAGRRLAQRQAQLRRQRPAARDARGGRGGARARRGLRAEAWYRSRRARSARTRRRPSPRRSCSRRRPARWASRCARR